MTPFYIPIFTWYEVSYLDQSMEFVIATLTYMGLTYALTMTTLVGPLQEIAEFAHQLLLWTCCLIPFFIGLLVSSHQHQQHIHPVPCHRWFVY